VQESRQLAGVTPVCLRSRYLQHGIFRMNTYPTGIVVPDEELAQVNLQRADFHGKWNHTILPQPKPNDTVIL
jgi:hypothetical protein